MSVRTCADCGHANSSHGNKLIASGGLFLPFPGCRASGCRCHGWRARAKPRKLAKPIVRRVRPKAKGRPRFKKGRDPAFIAWLHTQPCCVTTEAHHGPIQACHVTTRGAGGKDIGNAVSMCALHHARQGWMGIRTFEERTGINMRSHALRLAVLYRMDARRADGATQVD